MDCVLFSVAGAGGVILFFLSFISVHPCTWPNWSLVWLQPLDLIAVILFCVKKLKKAAYYYHFINFAALTLMLLGWYFIPQHLNKCLYSACSLDLGSFGLGCLQKYMENRMRKIITSLIAILVVTNLEAQQRTPKLVVCITVDQLRGDYIEYFYNTFGERGFKRLMNEGLVYNNIRFEFSDIDQASAFATLLPEATLASAVSRGRRRLISRKRKRSRS